MPTPLLISLPYLFFFGFVGVSIVSSYLIPLRQRLIQDGAHNLRTSQLFAQTTRGANSVISENRVSGFEYEFVERYQAGIVLTGTEVKSCRKGSVQLSDGLAEVRNGELWLLNVHISPHDRASSLTQHAPKRMRKLLLKRSEILKLEQRVLQRNMEIIPIRMFFNDKNFVKLELGVGSKKSLQDKRDDVMRRDGEREIRRVMKGSYD